MEVLYAEICNLFADAGFGGCISTSSENEDFFSPARKPFDQLWERFQELEEKLGLTSFEKLQSNPACIEFLRSVLRSLDELINQKGSRRNSRPPSKFNEPFEVYVAARAEFAAFIAACAGVGNWRIAAMFGLTMSLQSNWPDGKIPIQE